MNATPAYPNVLLLKLDGDKRPWGLLTQGTYRRLDGDPLLGKRFADRPSAAQYLTGLGFADCGEEEPGLWRI